MNADLAIPINWFLVVALLAIAAAWIGVWNHPDYLRRIAARYLARAESLDRSRTVFENSLRKWHKQLHVPERSAPARIGLRWPARAPDPE